MALNKHMHPRNIYKIPPDFAKLAKTYSEFSNIAKVEVTGKVSIDFKNAKSLRILTKYLLKSDFNVDIDIPEDRLVPTLPLRLNYILWLEDILVLMSRHEDIKGLDIGTGACAIYPILAAVKNKWHMVGTETDQESYQKAQDNICKNNLQELVQLRKNPTNTIIEHLLSTESNLKFDFCMCNPPFYSNIHELCESRSPARLPPKNGFTGSPQELITEGGELQFCKNLINESKTYQGIISIFTTMVGHKYNLKELMLDLRAEGIKHTNTEFCQGRVTRWGLAWTFQDYDLYKMVPPREKLRKKSVSVVYVLPPRDGELYTTNVVVEKLKQILQELNITYNIIDKRGSSVSLDIKAEVNTWSNQRRKRRLMKQLETENNKRVKLDEGIISGQEKLKKETESANLNIKEPIIQAILKIYKKDKDILLEMEFLTGQSGKEGLHQIAQYIKNNWKT